MPPTNSTAPRRRFLQGAAGSVLILRPETVFGSQANSAIEFGLIGCGGRGHYISDFFIEHTGSRVVALADAFESQLAKAREKYKVGAARAWAGLDAYSSLVESKIDAVVIETPTYFHPEQVEAAVNAGKHVFVAKPMAVDVPGCKRFLAAAEKARGRLSFLVDFQTRSQPVFQEAAARIHRGDIGAPVFGHIYYHARRLPVPDTTGMTPEQATLRNWFHDRRLSGDIIVEQNIHVIDVANWYLQSHTLRAFGSGGQKARLVGNTWDHYIVTYWYPNGVKVDFSSVQFAEGYGDLCMRVYGSEGTMDSHYNGFVRMTGKQSWNGAEKDPTFNQGAITNVKNFVASIRAGKPLNNAAESIESNLTAILGRNAAYREAVVTWEEMFNDNRPWDGSLRG